MFINTPKRILFIHNPKTAGLAIARAIGFCEDRPLSLSHLTSRTVREALLQSAWGEFYSFCFVREPIDRYYSLYHYQRSAKYGVLLRQNESHRIARTYNFVEWLYFNLNAGNASNHFGVPQAEWYEGVMKVFRFEDMGAARLQLMRDLGIDIDLKERNRGHYPALDRSSLPSEALDAIHDIDHQCIEDYYA